MVDDVVALHSSDPATVFLSVLVRMSDPSTEAIASVERALYVDRTVVRHHAMRRTLWVMSPHIARLAHAAATEKVARTERRRTVAALGQSGVDDPERWLDTAVREIEALLERDGPMSTRAIGAALNHLAVPVAFGSSTKNPVTMNAHAKVLQGAGFDGTLLRTEPTGSWISSEYLWAPTTSWIGEPLAGLEEAEAAAELLDLWLRRFGPATETDIAWWFKWTVGLTRRSLAAVDARPVELEGSESPGFVAVDDPDVPEDPGPWVRLLPGLDPTAMGWKERNWYIEPRFVPRLFDRAGNVGPTVWADGEIVGGWIQQPDGRIAVELLRDLDSAHAVLLDQAIDELRGAVGDVVVRPRFPAPSQRDLYAG